MLSASVKATEDLYPHGSMLEIDPSPIRTLTELEYYHSGCGYSISHLLNLIVQLEQVPAYLRNPRRSKVLSDAGVTRVSDLIYHWENYLIRGRSLEDRALQLVSAVFHLGINNKHVKFHLVRRNTHIAAAPVAEVLDRLQSLVAPLAGERNRLIHERGLLDADLRRVEFWLLASQIPGRGGYAKDQYLTRIRETAPRKAEEVEAFVVKAGDLLFDLFDKLLARYQQVLRQLGEVGV